MIRAFILQQLELVKPNMTSSKALQVCKDLDISTVTLYRYLSGDGPKVDIYDKIINHLKDN